MSDALEYPDSGSRSCHSPKALDHATTVFSERLNNEETNPVV